MSFSGDQTQITGKYLDATNSSFASNKTIMQAENTASLTNTTHTGGQTSLKAGSVSLQDVTSRQDVFAVESEHSTRIEGSDFKDSETQIKSGSTTHISNSKVTSTTLKSESGGRTIVTDSNIQSEVGHIRASELVLVDSVKGVQKGVQGNNSSKVKVDFSKAAYIDVDHDLDLRHNFGGRENLHLRQRHGDIVLDEDFHAASEHFSLNLDNGDLVLNAKKVQNQSGSSIFGRLGNWLGLGSFEIEEEAKGITFSGDGDMQINVKNFTSHGGKIVGKGYVAVKAQGDIKLLPITVTKTVKSFSGKMTETTAKQIISEINAGRVALDAGGRIDAIGSLIDAAGGIKLKAVEGVNLASAVEIFEKQVVTEGQKRFILFGDQDKTTERTHDKTHIMPTLKSQGDVIIEVSKGDLTTEGLDVSGAENFKIHVSEGNVTMKAVKDIHIYDKNEVKHHILSFSRDKGFSCMGDTKVEQHFYGEAVHPTIVSVGSGFYGYAKGKLVILEPKIDASKVHLYAPEGVVLESVPEYSYAFTKITETGLKIQLKSGAHEKTSKIKPQLANDGGEQKTKSSDEVRDIMRAAGSVSVEAGFYHTEEELREQRVKFNKGHVRTNEMVIKTSGDFVTKGVDIDSEATRIAAKNWFDTAVESRVSTEYKASEEFVGFKAGVEIAAMKYLEKHKALGDKLQKLGGRGDHMINAASDGYGLVRSGANLVQGVKAGKPISAGVNFKVSHEEERMATSSGEVHGNQHNLGEAVLRIEELWRTEASNITATNMEVTAKRFEAVAVESHTKQTSSSMSFNFEIPIGTPGASSLAGEIGGDLSVSMNVSEMEATSYTGGTIKVQGKLKMDVKDGKVIGTQIEADIVDISAENLLVKSVQDTMRSASRGFSMSLEPTDLLSGKVPELMDVVKGVYGEGGSGKAAITNNLGSIVGKAATKVVVGDTLTMAGGLIANASRDENGELTTKGEAQVKAANLIVEKLHDYDEGMTLWLGINPVSSTSKSAFGSEVRTKFQMKDQSRDVHSALVGLQVSVNGELIGSENLGSSFEIPKMQGTDIDLDVTFASMDFEKLKALGDSKKTGVASGSEEPGLFDFMKKPDAEEQLSDEEKALVKNLQDLNLSAEDASKIDVASQELASKFAEMNDAHNAEESLLQSAVDLAREYGQQVVSAALMVAQFLPQTAASGKLLGFLSKVDNAGVVLNCLSHLKGLPVRESLARGQVAELDWDPMNEQEQDLSMNPLLSGGPKAKFGHVDSEALTLDVLAASSMLIKGALGQKLHLAKFAAKAPERSKVPHGEVDDDLILKRGGKIDGSESSSRKVDAQELENIQQNIREIEHHVYDYKHMQAKTVADATETSSNKGPAQYHPDLKHSDVKKLEAEAIREAFENGKIYNKDHGSTGTKYIFYESDKVIGFSNGNKTKLIRVEMKENGPGKYEVHSHPVCENDPKVTKYTNEKKK